MTRRGKLVNIHNKMMRIQRGVVMPFIGHGFGPIMSETVSTPAKKDNINKLQKSFAHLSINAPKKTKPRYISF